MEDTGVVILAAAPAILPPGAGAPSIDVGSAPHVDEQGSHFHHHLENGQRLQLLCLTGAHPDSGLAAVIPLGLDGLDRLEAVTRLLRALHGRSVPPDTRLTRQQLRRARRMLQAVDGHASGASHREIAEVLFGRRDLADEPWKTSSRRFATMDLIKSGLAMTSGGYRRLLSHRRRR